MNYVVHSDALNSSGSLGCRCVCARITTNFLSRVSILFRGKLTFPRDFLTSAQGEPVPYIGDFQIDAGTRI